MARSARARGTAAPVATKMRSRFGGRRAGIHGAHQVGEEWRRGLHEGAFPAAQHLEGALRVPDRLHDLRRAEREREPHAVQEPGLVRQRGRDVDDVVGGQAEVLDLHLHGPAQGAVRVHDALRLSGGAGGEQQLRGIRGRGRPLVDRGAVHDGRGQRLVPAVPLHGRVGAVRQDAGGARCVVEHEHVFQREFLAAGSRGVHRPAQQFGDLGRVRPGPEVVDHHEHLRAGALQREGHLALPEDRHDRADHRADPHRGQRGDDEFPAVGQLHGDPIAGFDAQAEEHRRRLVHFGVEFAPS